MKPNKIELAYHAKVFDHHHFNLARLFVVHNIYNAISSQVWRRKNHTRGNHNFSN